MEKTNNRFGRGFIIVREGWAFVFIFAAVAAFVFALGFELPAAFLVVLTLFTIYFFRNPKRVSPGGEGLIVSPADGRVIEVKDVESNIYTSGVAKKVSIFMSVFNVHVNRSPIDASVEEVRYYPGRFFVASLDKASDANERNAIILNTGKGLKIAVVQIAGIVARRIVCYLKNGCDVSRGERLGMIRFGSRVELFLPQCVGLDVRPGDKVKAGLTTIGRFDEGRL